MLLNKNNFLTLDFVSQEPSRYTMQAIHVDGNGTTATNGHVLVQISLPDMNENNFPSIPGFTPEPCESEVVNGPYLIPMDAARKIMNAIPKEHIPVLNHCRIGQSGDDSLQIGVTDLDTPQIFRPKKVTGNFPGYEQIFKELDKPATVEIGFDAEYLIDVCNAVKKLKSGSRVSAVMIRVFDEKSAIELRAMNVDGQTLRGVIMPLRLDRKDVGMEPLPEKDQKVEPEPETTDAEPEAEPEKV